MKMINVLCIAYCITSINNQSKKIHNEFQNTNLTSINLISLQLDFLPLYIVRCLRV